MDASFDPCSLEPCSLVEELRTLRDALLVAPGPTAPTSDRCASLRNLDHYLALRAMDIRPLQERLTRVGLSSLGRCEANVLGAVTATLWAARALAGQPCAVEVGGCEGAPDVGEGKELLEQRTERLLGARPRGRGTRIMVTLPSEAAADRELVRRLVVAGADAVRINTTHDDEVAWRAMVRHVRASQRADRPVVVVFDLGGPKVRTGPLRPGPSVVKVSPRRDELGNVVEPARRWLLPPGVVAPVGGAEQAIPVRAAMEVHRGDRLHLRDARGARRSWIVAAVSGEAVLVEATRTAYVVAGTPIERGDTTVGHVGDVPAREEAWRLGGGDLVTLRRSGIPADPSGADIGCVPASVLDAVGVGHRVVFDDGRAGGVVEHLHGAGVDVRVTWPVGRRVRLRARKGINLPDSELGLPALTAGDLAALDVAVEVGDAVCLSFVRDPADVAVLQRELASRGARRELGVIAKIETERGFSRLPDVVRQLLESDAPGLMIARGDLAVEVGFERLAEVQEEILWLAEAAHVPVVWATQVLDQLSRTGVPTRAEITDAAAADRAECVMLNKGAHVDAAVAALADILRRMEDHHAKKQSLLRRLRAWEQRSQVV